VELCSTGQILRGAEPLRFSRPIDDVAVARMRNAIGFESEISLRKVASFQISARKNGLTKNTSYMLHT
jgi:hypothetical protein